MSGRSIRSRIAYGVMAVLIGAGVGMAGWWWQAQRQMGRAIDVPGYVSEPCASWFREVPPYDAGKPPSGWTSTLVQRIEGEQVVFGRIPGHYWRLTPDPNVVCGLHYNTGHTSASGEHPDALLYLVEGRLASLPLERNETPQPDEPWRVREELLEDAPVAWTQTAPEEPGYVYWRSYYHPGRRTAEPVGYWLRHVAFSTFTFDNGHADGNYAFTHRVEPGIDLRFAPKINFDAGP